MVLLNVSFLTNRNVITYREVTVIVSKTNAMVYTAAEPVMVLNKLYDLSNDRDNLFEQNVEIDQTAHIYHISLNFFVIADNFVTLYSQLS